MDFFKKFFFKHPLIITLLILSGVGFLIYSNTFNAPFVFDDYPNIVDNPYVRMTELDAEHIANLKKYPSEYRPVPNFTFALNYYFHGYEVAGYNLVNIVIHILNAFLVFLIFRQTLYLTGQKNDLIAACAALFWLVNPVHTQSVTYIVQRMTSMCAMFYLLSLYTYIKARINSVGGQAFSRKNLLLFLVSLLSFAAALLSKQIAATLPVFVFLYEWFFIRDLDAKWMKKNAKWIGLILAIIVLISFAYLGDSPIHRVLSGYESRDFTLLERLLTEPRVVLFYISILFVPLPSRLTLEHDFNVSTGLFDPITTFLSILIILTLLVFAVFSARRHRVLSFAIIWFFGNLVIESSIIPLEVVFEHRTYLPSVFLFFGFTYYLFWGAKAHSRWVAAFFVCIVFGFSGLTFARNYTWADAVRFHKDCLQKTPEKPRVVHNMGVAYYNNYNYEKALQYFKKTIKIEPDYADAYGKIGIIYYKKNENQAAVKNLKKAIQLEPNGPEILLFMGIVYNSLNKPDKAISYLNKALKLFPSYIEARINLGNSYLIKQKYDRALSEFSKVLEIDPEYYKAYNNIGYVYMQMNKKERAVKYFKQALKNNPEYGEAHLNLGSIYLRDGRLAKAEKHLLKAVNSVTESYEASIRTAEMYFQKKEYAKAKKYFKKAAELQPENSHPCLQLGIINLRKENYKNSKEYFVDAREKGAKKYLVYYYLGLAELLESNYQKSIASFERSLELNPEFLKAKRKLADTYMAAGDDDKALDLYNDVLSRDPADIHCLKQAAQIHLEKAQYEKALERFESAYQADNKDPSFIQNLAFLYARFERYEEAAAKFEELKEFKPENPLLHYNLACMYSETGNKKAALKNLELALEYGYDNKSKLMQDPNLEFVRKTKEFKKLVQNLPQ